MRVGGWRNKVLGRLILSFICIVLPIYLLSAIMYETGKETLRKEIHSSTEAQVSFYLGSLESEIKRIRILQYDLVNDRDINQLASIPESLDNIGTVMAMLRIQGRLLAIKGSSDYIQGATVYIPAAGKILTQSSVEDFDRGRFDAMVVRNGASAGKVAYGEDGLFMLSQYPPSHATNTRSTRFLIELELSKAAIERSLGSMCAEEGSGVALTRSGGRMVAAGGTAPKSLGNRRYLSVSKGSEYLDAILTKALPEDVIFKSLAGYKTWFALFVFAALLIIVVYSASIYGFIHKPLKALADSFKHVERGDFDIHIDHAGNDEFGYIYRQFNGMVANLKTLIDQVYNQKLLVQRAEMRQLQSQINPHFLYNSFFILNTMIRTEDYESLEALTRQLGQYFRFMTKNASEFVSLEDEAAHARIYAEIQTMRFSRRVELDFGPPPEGLEGLLVPRLILQPIIENGFEHGLCRTDERGRLSVAFAREGDFLAASVENTGAPIDEATLAAIRSKLGDAIEGDDESALQNIHLRLRLRFGPSSGLSVEPLPAGGLRVVARIDLREAGDA
jgi:two-component system, sensor histidine kinase YesM